MLKLNITKLIKIMFTDEELKHILQEIKDLYKNQISSKNEKKLRLSIINKIENSTDFLNCDLTDTEEPF